jgi:hypothetical protein
MSRIVADRQAQDTRAAVGRSRARAGDPPLRKAEGGSRSHDIAAEPCLPHPRIKLSRTRTEADGLDQPTTEPNAERDRVVL